jgi:chromate transporter
MPPALEVLARFLRLGLSSFGGPIAHLGYFRREFVEKRAWLTEPAFASLLALCQFLPGPASSQLGFGIGLRRAGWLGGIAAWVGFTLPSAILMFAIAMSAGRLTASHIGLGLLHGLQLAAIAVVAQAVYGMARSLCPDTPRRILAVAAIVILFLAHGGAGQLGVIILGGIIGRLFLTTAATAPQPEPGPALSKPIAIGLLALFTLLLAGSFHAAQGNLALFHAFYRAGALVFGGGHVVLPLLHDAIVRPGWVPQPLFLAGYGAAQAMPGPLFTFAAYLGALSTVGSGGPMGATVALVAIFLPGLLLVAGIMPFWAALRQNPGLAAALAGVNAAVVGLLAFALINLLTQGTIRNPIDALIAVTALALLTIGNARPIIAVALCAAAGVLFAAA